MRYAPEQRHHADSGADQVGGIGMRYRGRAQECGGHAVGRQDDRVGQTLDVEVDRGQRDADGAQVEKGGQLGRRADAQREQDKNCAGEHFDYRVTNRDPFEAAAAAPPLRQPADNGHILEDR